jgi:hypothetical protein
LSIFYLLQNDPLKQNIEPFISKQNIEPFTSKQNIEPFTSKTN